MSYFDPIVSAAAFVLASAICLTALTSGRGVIPPFMAAWPFVATLGWLAAVSSGGFAALFGAFYTVAAVLLLIGAGTAAVRRHSTSRDESLLVSSAVVASFAMPGVTAVALWTGASTWWSIFPCAACLPITMMAARLLHTHTFPAGYVAAGASTLAALIAPFVPSDSSVLDPSALAVVALLALAVAAAAVVTHFCVSMGRLTKPAATRWAFIAGSVLFAAVAVCSALHAASVLDGLGAIRAIVSSAAVGGICVGAGWIVHDMERARYNADTCDHTPSAVA